MTVKKNKIRFGVQFPEEWPDWQCVRWLFLFSPQLVKNPFWRPDIEGRPETYTRDGNPAPNPYTGLGRFQHLKQLTDYFMPKAFEWQDWSELISREVCENPLVAITGCGTSGKSTTLGNFAFWWWWAAPLESAALLISTTLDSSKKRIWKEVSRLYGAYSRSIGGWKAATIGSSPRPYISPYRLDLDDRKRDEAHGIYVSALQKKSETDEEMEYIKGFHPRRIMVVVDEMDSLREHGKALRKVFNENLASGAMEANFIALGNDPSLFNELGEIMQLNPGKPITLAEKEWTSIHGFRCLRLDAWDSPNVRDGGKWSGLIRQEDIDRISKDGMNTPGVWIQLHGLHPPEGADTTLLSESSFIRFHCREGVNWESDFESFAALDASLGGDNCVIRQYDYGRDTSGVERVFWHEPVYLRIDASLVDDPQEYQVARQSAEFMISRRIPWRNLIGDQTGTTHGCMSVLRNEYSSEIQVCNCSGAASDMPVSDEDPRPANEVYDRKVTELGFSLREFVQADMMRGLDNKTCSQACSRHFELRGRKLRLETKDEMKARGLDSPDELDCTCIGVEGLRRRGINAVIRTPVKEAVRVEVERELLEQDFDSGPTYQEDYDNSEVYEDF